MVRIGILGALQIERDGSPVEIAGGRLRALLARLALAGGKPVSTGALVDAVWDDELPVRPAARAAVADLARAPRARRRRRDRPRARRLHARGRRRRRAPLRAARRARARARCATATRSAPPTRSARRCGCGAAPRWPTSTSQPLLAAAAHLEDAKLNALADRAEAELALGHGAQGRRRARGGARRAPAARAPRRPPHLRALRRRPPGRRARRLRAGPRCGSTRSSARRPSPSSRRPTSKVLKGDTATPARASAATCARR